MFKISQLTQNLRRFGSNKDGAVLAYVAFAAPMFLGMAALAIDLGVWHAHKRGIQTMADSAAIAASLELRRGGNGQTAATFDAEANGFNSAAGDTIEFRSPPTTGDYAGDTEAVEIIVHRNVETFAASMVFAEQASVTARAVARSATLDSCVWGLDTTSGDSVTVSGNTTVDLNCGVFSNADLSVNGSGGGGNNGNSGNNGNNGNSGNSGNNGNSGNGGNNAVAALSATEIKAAGTVSGMASGTYKDGVSTFPDPLAALPEPAVGGCDHTNYVVSGNPDVLNPGVYCGGLRINSTDSVVLNPGLYVLNGGAMRINGQGEITDNGGGVTFFITGSGNGDAITVSGQADFSVTAPIDDTDDGIPGVLFFQDDDDPDLSHSFTGGSDLYFEGILYFPNQDISFSGGSSAAPSNSIFIAQNVTFAGASYLAATGGGNPALDANEYLIQTTLIE